MIDIKVVRKTQWYGDDLKIGDICKVSESMWNSEHQSTLVTKPDGSQFWYNKCQFKTLDEIRNDKLNNLGV